MNLSNCDRESFLRNCTCPVIEAPWSWKTRFAKSTPIIVSFVTVAVPSACGSEHHLFGTLRCRLKRAATTPSATTPSPAAGRAGLLWSAGDPIA